MSKNDGRITARENEIRCLRALHRFGWLRTRDLAVLCWSRWAVKPSGPLNLGPLQATASALRMAQRTLLRLHCARQLIKAQGPDGAIVYALAEAGARALREVGIITALSGKDLVRRYSSAYYRHRCIANQIAITGIIQGFRSSSEREIAQGLWLGGEGGIAGKKPDVLLRSGSQVTWIEVERSRKNSKDYKALIIWLGKMLRERTKVQGSILLGYTLNRIVFICRPAFEVKLVNDLVDAGWSQNEIESLISCNSTLYKFEDILFP